MFSNGAFNKETAFQLGLYPREMVIYIHEPLAWSTRKNCLRTILKGCAVGIAAEVRIFFSLLLN